MLNFFFSLSEREVQKNKEKNKMHVNPALALLSLLKVQLCHRQTSHGQEQTEPISTLGLIFQTKNLPQRATFMSHRLGSGHVPKRRELELWRFTQINWNFPLKVGIALVWWQKFNNWLPQEEKSKPWFIVCASFRGVNTPTMANFKLLRWHHWTRSRKARAAVQHYKLFPPRSYNRRA